MNANSKQKCPYGECDGSERIPYKNANGVQTARFCRCREYNAMKQKLKFANIPAEFEELTIKSFDTEKYSAQENKNLAKNIKKIAIQYVKRFEGMKKIGKGLYLYGETKGSGKTRLAISIGNALVTQKLTPVKFVTTVNLLEEIKSTWDETKPSKRTQSSLLSEIKSVDILILDDLGTEKPTAWVNEMFYNILNDRMTAHKVTIFTSNCKVEELKHDSRIINRIQKMAIPIKFPDESIRTVLAKQENEDILKLFLEG